MKHISKLLLSIFILCLIKENVLAQTNWNNIYHAPSAPNQGYIYRVKNSITVDGKIYMYGDTTGSYMQSPYVVSLNPQNQAVTPLTLLTFTSDYKMSSAAAINTPTAGVSYIYFGSQGQSAQYPGIYKYNTQTGITTPEQLTTGMSNYYDGIDNVIFFNQTGAGDFDTLNIFAKYFGYINVYRKHYGQAGISTFTALPLETVSSSIVYHDSLYLLGTQTVSSFSRQRLYKSADGLNYFECTNFSTIVDTLPSASYGFDMDTLNNNLFILMGDNESYTRILKTNNGSSFVETLPGGYNKRYVDLKNYKNKMWTCGKSMTFSSNYNDLIVSYLNPSGLDVTSVDTLGFVNNYGQFYNLNVVNDSLYCLGNFDYYVSIDYYSGIAAYKLTNPVAGISYMNNIACLNSTLSFTSTSTYADSLHWLLDTVLIASSQGPSASYNINFPSTGNHVVGLVAHGAGLTDTINVVISVYEVQASLAGSTEGCENVPLDLMVSELGAFPPVNYQWFQSGSGAGTDTTAFYTNPGIGNYSYNCIVTDVHGCIGLSDTMLVSIKTSKSILGTVTSNTIAPVAVAGNVILYKYEPFLTKFDSVTTQVIDAAGGYTFTSATAGDYIVKAVPSANTLQVTYGTSFTTWQNATILSHGCIVDETKNIEVQEFAALPGLGSGTGVLTGSVVQGNGFGQRPDGSSFKPTAPGNPIGGIVVKGGRNPGGQMFTQTITDPITGTYTLSGLPDNNGSTTGAEYFIQVDIPGLDTNGTYHRIISGTNNTYTNLDFVVDSIYVNPVNNSVGINDINATEHQLAVYPNPTTDKININFDLKSSSLVRIELFDIAGGIVKTLLPSTNLGSNKYKETYPLSDVNSGMYFIKLHIDGKESTIKICITH